MSRNASDAEDFIRVTEKQMEDELDKKYLKLMKACLAYVQECGREEREYQEAELKRVREEMKKEAVPKTPSPPTLLEPFPQHLIRMTSADR